MLILFTFVLLGWVGAASLSASKEIFTGKVLEFGTGLHFENYVKACTSSNVSTFFINSLMYALISGASLSLICAPAAMYYPGLISLQIRRYRKALYLQWECRQS